MNKARKNPKPLKTITIYWMKDSNSVFFVKYKYGFQACAKVIPENPIVQSMQKNPQFGMENFKSIEVHTQLKVYDPESILSQKDLEVNKREYNKENKNRISRQKLHFASKETIENRCQNIKKTKRSSKKRNFYQKKSTQFDLTTTERSHNIKSEVHTSSHGSNPFPQLAQKNTQNEVWSSCNKHEVLYRGQYLPNSFQNGRREEFVLGKDVKSKADQLLLFNNMINQNPEESIRNK
jgi:hypothetical protein